MMNPEKGLWMALRSKDAASVKALIAQGAGVNTVGAVRSPLVALPNGNS